MEQLFLFLFFFKLKEKAIDWFGFVFTFSSSWLEVRRELCGEVNQALYNCFFCGSETFRWQFAVVNTAGKSHNGVYTIL